MRNRVQLVFILSLLLCGCIGGAMGKGSHPRDFFDDPKIINLCHAVMSGDVQKIDQLVAEGVDVNSRGKGGMTPLLFSMVGFNKSGLERLMHHGANPNLQTEDKDSYMSFAAQANDADYLKIGLDHGGDPNLQGKMGRTLIFEAAMENNDSVQEVLSLLLDRGANINHLSKGLMENAAMAAARINQYRPAFILLSNGIDYQQKNKAGNTIARHLEANGIGYSPGNEGYDARTRVAAFLASHGVQVHLKKPYDAPADWLAQSFKAIGKSVPESVKETI